MRSGVPPGMRVGATLFALAFTCATAGAARAQEPLSWGAMQEEIQERSSPPPTRIPYGPGPERFGELRLPPGPGPHPVAIVVHGGCWLSIADLSYMRPLAQALNGLGWATWTLEFNRIDQPEGRWPGILEDVARGADELRRLAESSPLDLERVVSVGHSSGGHLALWLAARRGAAERDASLPGGDHDPLRVHGVVGLAPVTGLEDFQARSDRCGSTIVSDLLDADSEEGGAMETAEATSWARRLEETDPAHLRPLGVPQLLIFGERDRIVPQEHGRAWARGARGTGDPVELRVVPGAGHFELVAPWTPPWSRVEEEFRSFLAELESGA